MKLTLKLILFICLFSSVAFADGDQGNGGEGDQGNGGKKCPQGQTTCRPTEPTTDDGTILIIIQEYLMSIFG